MALTLAQIQSDPKSYIVAGAVVLVLLAGLGAIVWALMGIVEGVMVPALIGFGVPHSAALLGVIGWRLFEYWLPIPVGGIAYASLRFSGSSRRRA